MTLRRLVFLGILFEILFTLFHLPLAVPQAILLFMTVHAAGFVLLAYIIARTVFADGELLPEGPALFVIVAFGIVFRLTLVPVLPVASDDIFRYLWDGRVWLAGTNPYAFAPNDPRLGALATDVLPAMVNAAGIPTAYPPLAQVFFLSSAYLFGGSIAGMKLLLTAFDIATIFILILLLRRLGQNPVWVTLYAWSPLPILYFALDGHIDALGIPFMVLFILLTIQKRHVSGAVALGMSVLAKLYPLFLAPFQFSEIPGWKKWWVPVVPALMLVGGFVPFWIPGGGALSGIRTFGATWEFNGSIFWVFYLVLKSNEAAHVACAIAFAIFILVLFLKKGDFVGKVFWSFVGFIALSPTVHPWYLGWLMALLVIRWSLPVFLFLGLSVLSNIVVLDYRLGKGWNDQFWILGLEYGIPLIAAIIHYRRKSV